MTTPNMSCPRSGQFYACAEGSRFVGCCGRDPCATGCAAGDLVPTSFDASQYGQIPDQQCDAGQFYTCATTNPPFWGCCSTSPCDTGCPRNQSAAAFLSSNPKLAAPFLSLNETYSSSSVSSTASASASPKSGDGSSVNAGAIAGGAVGGFAVLTFLILGLVWFLRRRRRPSIDTAGSESVPQTQELPSNSAPHGFKDSQSYEYSPGISSYQSSPAIPQGSPTSHRYWGESQQQHISYELVGNSVAIAEMDSGQMASHGP